MKHTPGPWCVDPDGYGHFNVICNGEGFLGDIVGSEGLFRCDGSDEANAHLIAAAPDLLAAINRLQANPNDPRAHRQALDAIKKAEQS